MGDWLRIATRQDTSPQARRRRGRLGRSNLPWDGQISRLEWKSGDGCKPRRMTHGTNWPARQTLYGDTAGRAGIAYCGTPDAAAAQQRARQPASRYQARTTTGEVARGGPWS